MTRLRWLVAGIGALGVLFGAAAGIAAFTFVYADGAAYLTNQPSACANCHVMNDWYDGWLKSTHHAVAVCNDCHAPQALIPKLWVKARNGYHHSSAFTTGQFHEPIRISPANRAVTEAACRTCHGQIAEAMDGPHASTEAQVACIRCHNSVGHLSLD
jgi:cytochrome c nitrite reductase small subunit